MHLPILAATLAASFLTPFMVSSVNIALPAIGKSLSIGNLGLGWITTSYLLTTAVLLMPFGKLADRYGRKRLFTFGMAIIFLASVLSCLVASGVQLIVLRVLHGGGAAMIFGTGIALLTAECPAEKRGKMLGINISCTYLGLTLGPALGGVLVSYFGWRSIFIIPAVISAAVLVVTRYLSKDLQQKNSCDEIDIPGIVLYTLMLGSIITGVSHYAAYYGKLLLVTGALLLIPFIRIESRIRCPLIPVNLFRSNSSFRTSILATLFMYCATYAIGFIMSLYLQKIKHLAPSLSGLILLTQPIIMVLISPAAGRFADRMKRSWIVTAGMLCTTAGLLLISRLDVASSYVYIVNALILCGTGFALFSSPNMSIIMGSVDKEAYGTASATAGTVRLLGQLLSMGLVMFLISMSHHHQRSGDDQALINIIHAAGMSFSLLCGIGMVISLGGVKTKTEV